MWFVHFKSLCFVPRQLARMIFEPTVNTSLTLLGCKSRRICWEANHQAYGYRNLCVILFPLENGHPSLANIHLTAFSKQCADALLLPLFQEFLGPGAVFPLWHTWAVDAVRVACPRAACRGGTARHRSWAEQPHKGYKAKEGNQGRGLGSCGVAIQLDQSHFEQGPCHIIHAAAQAPRSLDCVDAGAIGVEIRPDLKRCDRPLRH